jgi:hypothetical protein
MESTGLSLLIISGMEKMEVYTHNLMIITLLGRMSTPEMTIILLR